MNTSTTRYVVASLEAMMIFNLVIHLYVTIGGALPLSSESWGEALAPPSTTTAVEDYNEKKFKIDHKYSFHPLA